MATSCKQPLKSLYFWVVANVLARRVSSRPMDTHFGRNTRKIQLISYNFMGEHAFWTASFQCLAKSLVVALWGV